LLGAVTTKRLGEDVGKLVVGWDVLDIDLGRGLLLTHKVVCHINVLGLLVKLRVVDQTDGALVIT
jgi:hypothetical protein